MALPLLLAFIGVIVLEGWTFARCVRLGWRSVVCWLCPACVVLAAVGSHWSTFHHEHWPNANTRFVGWPIPQIVFQRDIPEEPWLDFVGPTLILAWPMNFILFSLVPSLLLLPFTRQQGKV
ncbi:MAG TPA: hypothetical protein VGE39_14375 [Prosthecobacter sp.]